jgi:D-alanyl-D-alanine carboxypeptidase (penicillin-binding protein 5/6)
VSEVHLRALGQRAPELSPEVLKPIAREKAVRALQRTIGALVLVTVVAVIALQWFRPIASPEFRPELSNSIRLAGTSPSLPWPTTGAAALSVVGAGSLGHAGSGKPAPIAGITKVMTAYVVLKDHPLGLGASGPPILVTAAAVAAAQAGSASQQSVVPVVPGELLSELQTLEAVLVVSGNDIATLLADWDSGSVGAFVARMNATARSLGLSSTTFTDPSGVDVGSVSTPSDLIRLGEAAMAMPAFSAIVAMPQLSLPRAGLLYNPDADLGHEGIVGIKTGADAAAGGCFLFEAQQTVRGARLTVIGAVLGQYGTSPITTALYYAELLTHAAFAAADELPLVPPGRQVGTVLTSWRPADPVVVGSTDIVGWPGLVVPVRLEAPAHPSLGAKESRIGTLRCVLGSQDLDVVMRTARPLIAATPMWRLTRL